MPVNPDYVIMKDEQRVLMRNYEGKVFEYPEPVTAESFGGSRLNRLEMDWAPSAKW